MVGAYFLLLALLAVERLFELRTSKRNAEWAFEHGGVERGQTHFKVMKLLHVAFFVGCVTEVLVLERPFHVALGLPMLALALAAQGLRYWAIHTLGPYWNVRVLVVPGAPSVNHGPYRFLRHPNYLAVIIEGFAVPLIHSAALTAIAFSLANAALLVVRIRCEEAALNEHCDYRTRLGSRPRLWPARLRGDA